MFQPGQKAVCINGEFPLGIEKFYNELPKEGVTYTIRDIVPGISVGGKEGQVTVYLVEIKSPINKHGIERGFQHHRFAPLQTDEDAVEELIAEAAELEKKMPDHEEHEVWQDAPEPAETERELVPLKR